jgi:hypothetical protein
MGLCWQQQKGLARVLVLTGLPQRQQQEQAMLVCCAWVCDKPKHICRDDLTARFSVLLQHALRVLAHKEAANVCCSFEVKSLCATIEGCPAQTPVTRTTSDALAQLPTHKQEAAHGAVLSLPPSWTLPGWFLQLASNTGITLTRYAFHNMNKHQLN